VEVLVDRSPAQAPHRFICVSKILEDNLPPAVRVCIVSNVRLTDRSIRCYASSVDTAMREWSSVLQEAGLDYEERARTMSLIRQAYGELTPEIACDE